MNGQQEQSAQRWRWQPPELALYYAMVGCYFFAFGMQFVLFPALVTFFLGASAAGVGLAQSALSAPMFCLLLFGGLLAERAKAGPALAKLHVAFALATIGLAMILALQALTYPILIGYALLVGGCAAFMMPVRDAALNGVVMREAAHGRHTPLATAAATTTAVQIGAQIAGIVVARSAGATPVRYLAIQAIALLLGAGLALLLRAPKPTGHERTLAGALRDLREGLGYAFKHPIMGPMLVSAAYVGVFIVGSIQVFFPVIVRDGYGGDPNMQAQRLAVLFASFWGASFISAVILSRMKPLRHPGRAMILSHVASAAALFTFADHRPFAWFVAIAAFWGLAAGVAISMSRTIVQGAAQQRFLGRVLAIYSMGFMGGAPIGSAAVGLAATHLGPRAAALLPSGGLALAALALAVTTPLWRYTAAHAEPKS